MRYETFSARQSSACGGDLDDSVLTAAERTFLLELEARGVPFMIVGLTGAALQGANATTFDIDLWFAKSTDVRIAEAAEAAGGSLISGFGMRPPMFGGPLGERFDLVLHMSGLADFATEYANARLVRVEGLSVRVLPIERILVSKRAANRPKDLAAIPALEEVLAASEATTK